MLALRIVFWLERLAVQTGSAGKLKRHSLGLGAKPNQGMWSHIRTGNLEQESLGSF